MTLSRACFILATFVFALAFLIAIEFISSDDSDAFITGGFTLLAAGFALEGWVYQRRVVQA